jgi:acetyltransferase-like isoleucine patch superfamily enzyme
MKPGSRTHLEDPLRQIMRVRRKLHSLWLSWTYPFAAIGRRFSADSSCDVRRAIASYIKIGNNVLFDRNVRVDVVVVPRHSDPVILLDDGCNLGQRVTILAINKIHIERNNLFGPSVLVTDHNHEFANVTVPIMDQGTTQGGTVRIEEGCWIGFGAAIICSRGELVIGKNSVIAANSVVTRSVPPYSVVSGNPARVARQYDPTSGKWAKVSGEVNERGSVATGVL